VFDRGLLDVTFLWFLSKHLNRTSGSEAQNFIAPKIEQFMRFRNSQFCTLIFLATGCSSANVAGIELSQSLVYKLAEGHLEDAYLKKCLAAIEKLCKEFHLLIHMNFPPEHPVSTFLITTWDASALHTDKVMTSLLWRCFMFRAWWY